MSVFKLPFGLCDELNAVVAKFWWGKKGRRGVHWKKWKFLCKEKNEGELGFREFGKFNQAMVGKQAWRLIEFPNSLVARVLKARYFPNNSFLQANIGSNPSFVWRSIIWGRELVEKGCIRRIGNGEATRIYSDKWIPRPSLFKTWSPVVLNSAATVNELFLPSGEWNIPLIYNTFNKDEADIISGIPRGNRNDIDQWRWFFEKNGRYTVISGYKLALEIKKNLSNIGGGSSNEANRKFWKVIWGLHIPNKIKIFLWRAVHDILPCTFNLRQRKITNNPCCFRCGFKAETTLHALRECDFSQKVWKKSRWKTSGKNHFVFASWCEATIGQATKNEMELFAYVTWYLWTLRNDHLHGKINSQSPSCIISKAASLLGEFQEANTFRGPQKVNRDCKWQPPSEGVYKLNTDGAADPRNGRRGLGAVIRNENGELMGASAQQTIGTFSPLVTELLALKAGLCFAIDLRTLPVVIEVDSTEVVRLVNAPDPCFAEEGFLVEEVKSLVKVCSASNLTFKPRECNNVAHSLAKFILYENGNMFCLEHGPQWLMELVKTDSDGCNPSFN